MKGLIKIQRSRSFASHGKSSESNWPHLDNVLKLLAGLLEHICYIGQHWTLWVRGLCQKRSTDMS